MTVMASSLQKKLCHLSSRISVPVQVEERKPRGTGWLGSPGKLLEVDENEMVVLCCGPSWTAAGVLVWFYEGEWNGNWKRKIDENLLLLLTMNDIFSCVCQEFCLVHYAGPVTYDVNGFLDKNSDLLYRDLKQVLHSHHHHYHHRLLSYNVFISE